MHEKSVVRLDRAAVALLQALKEYGPELVTYLEPGQMDTLQAEVINLRRSLLGLQMGELYQNWDASPDVLRQIIQKETTMPLEQAAEQAADLLKDNSQADNG